MFLNQLCIGNENKRYVQYLVTAAVTVSMFTTGIHYGWPSPSLPIILDPPYNLSSTQASYVTTTITFGDIIGEIVASIVIDKIGRKVVILTNVVPQSLAFVFIYFSGHSTVLLYLARFLAGFSEGVCLTVLPIYICEISQPEIRGILASSIAFTWIAGSLFVNLVGSYCDIQVTALVSLIFPVVSIVTTLFIPESPHYFLMRDKRESAVGALIKLRQKNDVDGELDEIHVEIKKQMTFVQTAGFKEVYLNGANVSALIAVIGLMVFGAFTGVASLTFYAQLFFKQSTDTIPEDWAATLIISLQLIFVAISVLLVDRTGKKLLLYVSMSGCCLTLVILAVYFFALADFSHLNFLPILLTVLLNFFYFVGTGNVTNCLLGELFSSNVKAKAVFIVNMFYSLFTFLSATIYQQLFDNVHRGLPFAVFACVEFVGIYFVWKFVPETKGKTLEQIQGMFEKKKGQMKVEI